MDLPPVLPQFPVEVVYSTRNVVYGRDVGVATFIDGALHFQGRKSRFSLAQAAWKTEDPTAYRFQHWYTLSTVYRGVPFLVSMSCYDSVPGVGGGFQRAMKERMAHPETSLADPVRSLVMPPLVPDPSLRPAFWKMDVRLAIVFMMFAAAFVCGLNRSDLVSIIFFGCLCLASVLALIIYFLQCQRERRTFASLERFRTTPLPETETSQIDPTVDLTA
jgi:hypothetical protein